MVRKKTSADEVTQTEAKKATSKTAKVKTPTAKETTKKTATKKKAEPVVDKKVDVVSEVLEIKAQNEEKKNAKATKKATKTVTKNASNSDIVVNDASVSAGEGIGSKAQTDNSKRCNMKKNVQKAETKKFLEQKEAEILNSCNCGDECCCEKNGIISSWLRAYKNIINFKGRTSRYEFWSFILVNYILITIITGSTFVMSLDKKLNETLFFALSIVFSVILLLTFTSLCVRRIHDTGQSAWKGLFCPTVCYGTLWTIFSVINNLYYDTFIASKLLSVLFSVGYIVSFLCFIYYSIKIFLIASFKEEELGTNDYGIVTYCSDKHKKSAFSMAAMYITLFMIASIIQVYYAFYYLFASYIMSTNGGL